MLDLVGRRFTLFGSGPAWRAVGENTVPMNVAAVGDELADPEGERHCAYGLEPGGAVLTRPDGYVAWRTPRAVADAPATLRGVLGSLGLTR